MPLSEEELRLLEQMERALVAEDPKLASTMRGTRARRTARRHLVLGVLAFVVGVAVLMSGAVLRNEYLGVLGFVLMLAAAYSTLSTWRGQSRSGAAAPTGHPAGSGDPSLRVIPGGRASRVRPSRSSSTRPPKQGTMMQRFEERWRRRREQNGGM